jgi:DNA-binding XRE family transcriptional regulator
LSNYIRAYRKKAGLTQKELSDIVGYVTQDAIYCHELTRTMPPLVIALSYAAVFRVSVYDIFAGLNDYVTQAIEGRVEAFERDLQKRSARGRNASTVARKLEWLSERRS